MCTTYRLKNRIDKSYKKQKEKITWINASAAKRVKQSRLTAKAQSHHRNFNNLPSLRRLVNGKHNTTILYGIKLEV